MSQRPARQTRRSKRQENLAAFAATMVPSLMPTLKNLLDQHGRENTAFLVQPLPDCPADYNCDVCNRAEMATTYAPDHPEIAKAIDLSPGVPVLLLDRNHWFCFSVG